MRPLRRFSPSWDDLYLLNQNDSIYNAPVARRKTKGTLGGWRPGAGRKPVLEDPVSITFDLERPQVDVLKTVAAERGVSVASLVRNAVGAYLRRLRRL